MLVEATDYQQRDQVVKKREPMTEPSIRLKVKVPSLILFYGSGGQNSIISSKPCALFRAVFIQTKRIEKRERLSRSQFVRVSKRRCVGFHEREGRARNKRLLNLRNTTSCALGPFLSNVKILPNVSGSRSQFVGFSKRRYVGFRERQGRARNTKAAQFAKHEVERKIACGLCYGSSQATPSLQSTRDYGRPEKAKLWAWFAGWGGC